VFSTSAKFTFAFNVLSDIEGMKARSFGCSSPVLIDVGLCGRVLLEFWYLISSCFLLTDRPRKWHIFASSVADVATAIDAEWCA